MNPYRILIVEDELIVARDLESRLAALGYNVIALADTGAAAVAMAQAHEPDLVLMDIHLAGGMDGIAAALQIRRHRSIPVIFLTAYGDDSTVQQARLAEPYGYVLKPVEDRELLIVIELSLARHQAEKRLQARERELSTIIETAQDGFFLTDMSGRFLEVNTAACQMTGYSREELLQMSIMELEVESSDGGMGVGIPALAERGSLRMERPARRKDGQVVDFDMSINYLRVNGGRLFCFMHDITERRRLEEQLRQSQKMEGIGHLAGGIAHEFNNILAAMMMHLDLFRMSVPGEWRQESLQDMDILTRRAAEVVRQLLAFSRQSVLDTKTLDLREVVANFSWKQQQLIGEHIEHEFSCPEYLPTVQADEGMIEQVLINLCANARDAMPQGGRLSIRLQETVVDSEYAAWHIDARAGRFVTLTVSDTGLGMSEATLKRLFEPFFTTKDVGQGPGLGLPAVHGIVHQHRGWIEVESALGKGSTFRIYLPVESPRTEAPAEVASTVAIRGGNETILLVEDASALRKITAEFLRRWGYAVLEAANAGEALSLWAIHASAIDLLFTDMMLPDSISGKEIAERLHEAKPDLKVIITSGYSTEVLQHGVPVGFDVIYLQKPYKAAVVGRVVRECLDGRGVSR